MNNDSLTLSPSPKDYKCEKCGVTFSNRYKYSSHFGVKHPKPGVIYHKFTTENNPWVNISQDTRSKYIKSSYDSRFGYLNDISLTHLQTQVILGSLMGDMCIWKQRHKKSNPELRISHSIKQTEYVMWKHGILKNISRKDPYELVRKTGFGKGLSMYRFESKSLNCLNQIYDIVIDCNGKKNITDKWLNLIDDPVAIATWYMDDGSSQNGKYPWFVMGLCTDQEVNTIQNWLQSIWGLETTCKRSKGYYNDNTYAILHISKDSVGKFKQLVDPFIIPSMRYKIGDLPII